MKAATSKAAMLLPLILTGCASTPQVRDLASRTGVFVTSMEQGMAQFVADQNRLNQDNEARLRRMSDDAARHRARVAQQRLAWASAGDRQVADAHAQAAEVTAVAVAAQMQSAPVQAATVGFDGGESYKKASKALTEVATKPKLTAVLAGVLQYAGAVQTAFETLQEESAASAEAAADAGDAAADAAANAAGAVNP